MSGGNRLLRRNVTLAFAACQRHSPVGLGLTFLRGLHIFGRTRRGHAEVAELVDAPDSGSGPGNRVEVRVLSSAL